MPEKTHKTDILIAGGGVAGLTLALLLGDAGLDVTIIDPYPAPEPQAVKPSGRTVALMQTSLNVMRAAGVYDSCEDRSCPLEIMRIIDDSLPGREPLEAAFHAEDIGMEYFGRNIPNGYLRAVLMQRAVSHGAIRCCMPDTLESYETDTSGITARLKSGQTIRTPLIVGADGRKSLIRKVSGIEDRSHDYGQKAITCLINHSRSHGNTSTEFHRPSGPMAFVPLPGNISAIVWVEPSEKADAFIALDKASFTQAIQERSHDILGGITLETPPESWPLRSMQAKTLIAPRAALIAEAAHVMSPITAQGLNLSLRDVAALAETIVDAARLGLDHGSMETLRRYEKRRRIDVTTRVFGVDALNRFVSTPASSLKALRRTGLQMTSTLPPLRLLAMRHGLAPQLDAGRLLQGLPL